ncbi:MAG: Na/Pi cotransporter family protein [Clostridia bacterium]|nr:Na/Pi cotransporter family protein [Clostridia bacterium]
MGIGEAFNSIIFPLIFGLGAFLFGMKFMGNGLESVAGSRLSAIMNKLTGNSAKGFLFGFGATVVIQSSGAATVMVMGLVNAGIVDLVQAASVIIGANVGTTITSILIAFKISFIAPVCIFIGAVLYLYAKKKSLKSLGQIVLGFGLLFEGLHQIGASMKNIDFQSLIGGVTSIAVWGPLIGFLIGIIMCAVMQSSSASVGVIQAMFLEGTGALPMPFVSCCIAGINLGSSMPTVISSFNAKNDAKRASFIYMFYNLVGCVLFVPLTLFTPYVEWIGATGATEIWQVSIFHIIFKLVSAVICLPLIKPIVKLSYKFIPKVDHEGELRLEHIDVNLKGAPTTAMIQVQKEVERLGKLTRENLVLAIDGLINRSLENVDKIREQENTVDYLTNAITEYMISVNVNALPENVSNYLGRVFHVVTDLERISDHAMNIVEKTEKFVEQKLSFSDLARSEIDPIVEHNIVLFDLAMKDFLANRATEHDLEIMNKHEAQIDLLTKEAQNNHIERLKARECNTETGVFFVQLMRDLERVGDHSYNIGWLSNAENDGKVKEV